MDDRDMVATSSASSPATAASPAAPVTTIDLGPETEFTFDFALDEWANLTAHKVHSPWKYWAGYKWRLLICPRGSHGYVENKYISVYLACGGPCEEPPPPAEIDGGIAAGSQAGRGEEGEGEGGLQVPKVPAVWRQPARVWLSLIPAARTAQGTEAPSMDASHAFTENEEDWGFADLYPLTDIEKNGFCDEEGRVSVRARIKLGDDVADSTFNRGTRVSKLRSSITAALTDIGACLSPSRRCRWVRVLCGSVMAMRYGARGRWFWIFFCLDIGCAEWFLRTGALQNGWKAGFCALTASKVEQDEVSAVFCAEVEGIYGETLEIVEKRMVPLGRHQDALTVTDLNVCSFFRHSDAEMEGPAILVRNQGIFRCWIKAKEASLLDFFVTASETVPWPTRRDAKLSRVTPSFDPAIFVRCLDLNLLIAILVLLWLP